MIGCLKSKLDSQQQQQQQDYASVKFLSRTFIVVVVADDVVVGANSLDLKCNLSAQQNTESNFPAEIVNYWKKNYIKTNIFGAEPS